MSSWMVLSDEASITVPDSPIMNRLRRSLENGLPSASERENMKERRNMTLFLDRDGLSQERPSVNWKVRGKKYGDLSGVYGG